MSYAINGKLVERIRALERRHDEQVAFIRGEHVADTWTPADDGAYVSEATIEAMARTSLERAGVFSPDAKQLFEARTAALKAYEADVAEVMKATS